jgi:hypothetical protein
VRRVSVDAAFNRARRVQWLPVVDILRVSTVARVSILPAFVGNPVPDQAFHFDRNYSLMRAVSTSDDYLPRKSFDLRSAGHGNDLLHLIQVNRHLADLDMSA